MTASGLTWPQVCQEVNIPPVSSLLHTSSNLRSRGIPPGMYPGQVAKEYYCLREKNTCGVLFLAVNVQCLPSIGQDGCL
jgi:hypothetical protein